MDLRFQGFCHRLNSFAQEGNPKLRTRRFGDLSSFGEHLPGDIPQFPSSMFRDDDYLFHQVSPPLSLRISNTFCAISSGFPPNISAPSPDGGRKIFSNWISEPESPTSSAFRLRSDVPRVWISFLAT